MSRRAAVVVVVVIALLCLLVLGDYLGLFGVVHKDGARAVNFQVSCRDAASNAPIPGVAVEILDPTGVPKTPRDGTGGSGPLTPPWRVRLLGHPSDAWGLVKGQVLYPTAFRRSWLFTRQEGNGPEGIGVRMRLSHGSHEDQTLTAPMAELERGLSVRLQPRSPQGGQSVRDGK